MAYEKEKKEFVDRKKQEEKTKMIIMIVCFAVGFTLIMIGANVGGLGLLFLLLLGLAGLGAGAYFLKQYLDARKWRIHYESKDPEYFRPKTAEERAETAKFIEKMQREPYEKADANGSLEGYAFDNYVTHLCTEYNMKKYYGLQIDIYSIPNERKNAVRLDVRVKGTLSYCGPLQEKIHNSSDVYGKEMDRLQEKYGSELGRAISYDNGLFDDWQVALHNDQARDLIDAKKGIKRYVAKYYLQPILEHANKYNGINYHGKVYRVIDVVWDILLDSPFYYTDKALKKLNQDTRH